MSKVKFLFFSALQDITDSNTLEIDIDGTIQDALDKIFELYGPVFKKRIIDENSGNIKRYIIVAINRKDIRHLNGLETGLSDGDEISLLPAAAGG